MLLFTCSQIGNIVSLYVRVIKLKTLLTFWNSKKDSEQPLKSWYQEAKHATWDNPNEVKIRYPMASILKYNRVVFNIAHNKYRLVVRINYDYKIIYIRFIGTHSEYDKINAEKI
jgi:mRNA interferase HigB